MEIELTRKLKIALLESVKSGTLDLSIFDEAKAEQMPDIETIERETVRLEKLYGNEYLLALSDLMRLYATNQISESEYIKQRINLNN